MNIVERGSPNQSARSTQSVDCIVIHSTEGSMPGCLEWLRNPQSQVSAHYLIARDATIYALVPESRKAWHAGRSEWRGRGDVNQFSIGIELENPPGNQTPYTAEQYTALAELMADIRSRRGPLPHVDHSAIAIPAGRKTCPEPDLDWSQVQEPPAGADVWTQPVASVAREGETVGDLIRRLIAA